MLTENPQLPLPILDIRTLSKIHREIIAENVHSHSGQATIFFHPFYNDGYYDIDEEGGVQQYTHSNEMRDWISENPGTTFVFESKEEYERTIRKLAHPERQGIVCMVPARRDYPDPLLLPEERDLIYQWAMLVSKLKSFGVTGLALAGRKYCHGANGPTGCLPLAQKELVKHFDVQYIPSLCFPDQP